METIFYEYLPHPPPNGTKKTYHQISLLSFDLRYTKFHQNWRYGSRFIALSRNKQTYKYRPEIEAFKISLKIVYTVYPYNNIYRCTARVYSLITSDEGSYTWTSLTRSAVHIVPVTVPGYSYNQQRKQ